MKNSSIELIKRNIDKYQPGYSLQQSFYKNPEVYNLEIDKIFLKNWIFAGHESQISEVGNYFTLNFDAESVIIVRSSNDSIKAHINICRHRGSQLCTDKNGTKKVFTCPYHAWSYNLNGNLISARNMSNTFDRSANKLRPVHLKMVGGLIFISLAERPPSLDAMQTDLIDIFNHYGFNKLKLAEHKTYRILANWKLAVENYQECYHCTPSHQEFAQIHAMAQSPEIFTALKSKFWADHKNDLLFKVFNYYFDKAKPDSESYQYDRNPLIKGKLTGSVKGESIAPLLGEINSYQGGASELMVGPINFFLLYDDYIVGFRFLPHSIDECDCDVFWFINENAEAGKHYELEKLTWLWDITTQADKTIIENNQKGVESRFYQPGQLSEMETFQQSFLNWYLQTIRD